MSDTEAKDEAQPDSAQPGYSSAIVIDESTQARSLEGEEQHHNNPSVQQDPDAGEPLDDLPTSNPDDEDAFVGDDEDELPPPKYEAPSIKKAWEFYHSNLPRRIKVQKGKHVGAHANLFGNAEVDSTSQQSEKGTGYRLARAGEAFDPISGAPAQLYGIFGSFNEMDEFGIGISLYFRQLLFLFVVVSLCAVVNLSTIESNISSFNPDNTPWYLSGSVWGAERDDLSMASQGTADILTCCILGISVFFLKKFETKNIELIDVAQQTPTDYTVRVRNLPTHITMPDKYREFFSKWGDVVFVTIATKNGPLLKILAEGREYQEVIQTKMTEDSAAIANGKPNFTQDGLTAEQLAQQEKSGKFVTVEYLKKKKADIAKRAEALSNVKYPPANVYITFNTESAQRKCLKECKTGLLEAWLNIEFTTTKYSTFEGKVLKIDEPVEPSEVIYENLHLSFFDYWIGLFKSYVITTIILVVSFFILEGLTVDSTTPPVEGEETESTNVNFAAALFVSALNGGLPWVLKTLTVRYEVHIDEGDLQTSMLRKLMIARCLNTAVLMWAVTSFENQFGEGNLWSIQSILIADAFTTPIMRLLNIYEHVMHYVVAPRESTQNDMNLYFRGAYWNLAERYTDMIKTLFVGLFFSTIIPSALFITAIAMLTTYAVDKYCLLRVWARPPMYDESMASASRKMIIVCVWAHLIMARIFFSNWPYRDASTEEAECDLFTCVENSNGPGWSDEQRDVVGVYTVVGILTFIFVLFQTVLRNFFNAFIQLCSGDVDIVGDASAIQFRNLTGVSAYIPRLFRPSLFDPVFACSVATIPRQYIPCRMKTIDGEKLDPNDLSMSSEEDLPFIEEEGRDILFGVCKYYLPPLSQQQAATNEIGVSEFRPGQQVQQQQHQQQSHQLRAQDAAAAATATAAATLQQTMNFGSGFSAQIQKNLAHFRPGQQQQQVQMQVPYVQGQGQRHVQPQQQQQQQQQQFQQQQMQMQQQQMQHQQQQQQQHANTNFQPLPAGWEEKQAQDGRLYYVNHTTQKTQWTKPAYRVPSGSNPPARAVAGSNRAQLPQGWEMKNAPNGRPYFVNHNTGVTSWSPP